MYETIIDTHSSHDSGRRHIHIYDTDAEACLCGHSPFIYELSPTGGRTLKEFIESPDGRYPLCKKCLREATKKMHLKDPKNLKRITFTGVDRRTNIRELKAIQETFPMAEFGVLVSGNWQENSNRFLSPTEYFKLKDSGLNLSCHLCGRLAREAMNNNFTPAIEFINRFGDYFGMFSRLQINVGNSDNCPQRLRLDIPGTIQEVIIQQRASTECGLFLSGLPNRRLSVLLDGSGGQGIETSIEVLKCSNPVGYAGGFGPENIVRKINIILSSPDVGPFWVDMETKVRSVQDWLDTEKIWKTLNTLRNNRLI